MKYYVIKTHYVPAETNKNGVEHNWFSGKGGSSMNTEFGFDMDKNQLWDIKYALETYAFTSLAGAKRALKSHKELNDWETSYGHWIAKSEIIEINR